MSPSRGVEILGVAFCGPCAREQEAYFAIGELTREEVQDLHSKALAEVLSRMRKERALTGGFIAPQRDRGVIDESVVVTESSRPVGPGVGAGRPAEQIPPSLAFVGPSAPREAHPSAGVGRRLDPGSLSETWSAWTRV